MCSWLLTWNHAGRGWPPSRPVAAAPAAAGAGAPGGGKPSLPAAQRNRAAARTQRWAQRWNNSRNILCCQPSPAPSPAAVARAGAAAWRLAGGRGATTLRRVLRRHPAGANGRSRTLVAASQGKTVTPRASFVRNLAVVANQLPGQPGQAGPTSMAKAQRRGCHGCNTLRRHTHCRQQGCPLRTGVAEGDELSDQPPRGQQPRPPAWTPGGQPGHLAGAPGHNFSHSMPGTQTITGVSWSNVAASEPFVTCG